MPRLSTRSRASLADRLTAPIQRFLAIEAASTILLVLATVIALAWANSPYFESYEHLIHVPIAVSFGGYELALSLGHWVNDGLMVLFFFVVGMEIKRELVHGELSTRDRAMLPVAGALGGMLVPAAIYASSCRRSRRPPDGESPWPRTSPSRWPRSPSSGPGFRRASRSSCSRSPSSTTSARSR